MRRRVPSLAREDPSHCDAERNDPIAPAGGSRMLGAVTRETLMFHATSTFESLAIYAILTLVAVIMMLVPRAGRGGAARAPGIGDWVMDCASA